MTGVQTCALPISVHDDVRRRAAHRLALIAVKRDAVAVTVVHAHNRQRCRAEHLRALADRLAKVIADIGAAAHDRILLRAGDRDGQHLAERRRAVELAQPDLRAVKRIVILPCRLPDGLVRGRECLDDGPAGRITAAAAADDLRDERKRALIGAVIADVQALVGIEHADERDVFKIQPLRDHLRADHDGDALARKALQQRLMRASHGDGIGVHAQRLYTGKQRVQICLDALRPVAEKAQLPAADRALGIDTPPVAAVVADEHLIALMIRQADAAVRARIGRAALGTGDDLACTAPVEKQNALLAAAQIFLQLAVEHGADGAGIAIAQFLLHVGNDNVRQLAGIEPVRQCEVMIAAGLGIITADDVRRRRTEQSLFQHQLLVFCKLINIKLRQFT